MMVSRPTGSCHETKEVSTNETSLSSTTGSETLAYALLDTQSSKTFVDQDLCEKLHATNEPVKSEIIPQRPPSAYLLSTAETSSHWREHTFPPVILLTGGVILHPLPMRYLH